jgi:hypothetical protein
MFMFYLMRPDGSIEGTNDLSKWGFWFEKDENRRVAFTEVGDIKVSTVCMGIVSGFDRSNKPYIFETYVWPCPDGIPNRMRYTTLEEAKKGHEEIVKSLHKLVC